MAWFWWLIFIVIVFVWIASVVDIIRRRHTFSRGALFAWILLVIIIPIIGTVTYFLVNGAFGSGGSGTRDPDATRYGR